MITVCIVEDQHMVRKAIEDILHASDSISCIGSFPNAEMFIEKYEELQPDISLIDLDLPGITGAEAIFAVKSNYPRAKFLVLTIFNDDEKVFTALKSGAGGYLLKKHFFDHLVTEITELYNNGAPMSPEIARKVIAYFQRDDEKLRFNALTEKEKSVLALIVEGFLYKEIAGKLNVGIDAIKKHAHNIYEKLQVRNRSEVVKKYMSN
ncbi:MAG: response regulator transcription factor [Agriterribacter sp.]